MKILMMCFALVMVNASQAAGGEWQKLQDGIYSRVIEQQFWIVRSPDGLRALREQTGLSPGLNRDGLNLDNQMLVAIFYGQRPTGGYSIEVDSVEKSDSRIHIKIREHKPSKDMMVTQAITSPFLFIMLPRSERKVVVSYIE